MAGVCLGYFVVIPRACSSLSNTNKYLASVRVGGGQLRLVRLTHVSGIRHCFELPLVVLVLANLGS